MSKIKLLLIATVSGEFEIDTDDFTDDLDNTSPTEVREHLLQLLEYDFFNEIDNIDALQELTASEIKLTEVREAAAALRPATKPGNPL